MTATIARPLAAEFLGTALLMAVVVGSSAMGAALGAGPALGLLASALVTGLALFVLITILSPLSGAHLNPAVTLVMALNGALPAGRALAFALAQVAGAFAGAGLAHLMFALPAFTASQIERATGGLWLSEVVATFGLVFVILGGIRAGGNVAALVGAYITAGYWFTASTSFANPAMTLARAATGTGAGLRAADLPAYLAAQILGAVLALALGRWLFAAPRPGQEP
ncbi:MAG: aquaporin [Paracoccaceae bacterium]